MTQNPPKRIDSNQTTLTHRWMAAVTATLLLAAFPAVAQDVREPGISGIDETLIKKLLVAPGNVIIPASSRIVAADKGKRAHTNFRFLVPTTACARGRVVRMG